MQKGGRGSINWYWLSGKKDVLNWNQIYLVLTPQSAFTDYSALGNMAKTTLTLSHTSNKTEREASHKNHHNQYRENRSFFVHIRALKGTRAAKIFCLLF